MEMISRSPWIFFLLISGSIIPCLAQSSQDQPTPPSLSPVVQMKDFHPPRPSDPGHVRLAFVGDINLGRHVGELLEKKGDQWALAACKPVFDEADLVVANLESPVGEGGEKYTEKS